MDRITILRSSNNKIGLLTRKNTIGTELEMVNDFVEYYCQSFASNNKKMNLAVFVEPQLISGYPDIVFAIYSPEIVDSWSVERRMLSKDDLKVLSYLLAQHSCNGQQIVSALRMKECGVITSLEKLYDAQIIERTNKTWKVTSKKRAYSIQKLIAVEAKVGDVNSLIDQAFINTWFASQSFALTGSMMPRQSTMAKFQKCGVGLYCRNKGFSKVVEAKNHTSLSVASLQFNEWIGNYLTT